MTAVAWTAIGLLAATLFGMLFYLGQRIDALAVRIDVQGAELGQRIDALAARLDGRIDSLSSTLHDHLGRHAG